MCESVWQTNKLHGIILPPAHPAVDSYTRCQLNIDPGKGLMVTATILDFKLPAINPPIVCRNAVLLGISVEDINPAYQDCHTINKRNEVLSVKSVQIVYEHIRKFPVTFVISYKGKKNKLLITIITVCILMQEICYLYPTCWRRTKCYFYSAHNKSFVAS